MDTNAARERRPKATIRQSKWLDAYELGPRLRQADKDEVMALASLRPIEALKLGLENSYPGMAWSGEIDGRVEVMFGVGKSAAIGVGHPWLLASDGIETLPTTFLRESRRYVSRMHAQFPILTNVVDARHSAAIRWLRWLGFEFVRIWPNYGHEKRTFIQFVKI